MYAHYYIGPNVIGYFHLPVHIFCFVLIGRYHVKWPLKLNGAQERRTEQQQQQIGVDLAHAQRSPARNKT